MAVAQGAVPYPVRFDVDYPESLDRVSTLLRVLWIIPIAILYILLTGGAMSFGAEDDGLRSAGGGVGGLLVLPTVLMLLFRRKYPRWWFDFNRDLTRLGARLTSYLTAAARRVPLDR